MRFRQASLGAVELREPARPTLKWQAQGLEVLIECPSRGIDGGGIFEWSLRLCQNTLGHLWFLLQEHGQLLRPLGDVAFLTGQGEIADAVAPPIGSRNDMLDLQRNLLLAAIGAGACPLLKQIFSQFVAEKGPLLVFASLDLWMFQLLQIEADQLHADRRDGAKLA